MKFVDFIRPNKDESFTDWPAINEVLYDNIGRRLTVSEINPIDRLERNIVGKLNNNESYSCDIRTLLAIWKRSK